MYSENISNPLLKEDLILIENCLNIIVDLVVFIEDKNFDKAKKLLDEFYTSLRNRSSRIFGPHSHDVINYLESLELAIQKKDISSAKINVQALRSELSYIINNEQENYS